MDDNHHYAFRVEYRTENSKYGEHHSDAMSYWEAAQEAIEELGITKEQIHTIRKTGGDGYQLAWCPGTDRDGEVINIFYLVPEENTQVYLGPEEGGSWGNISSPMAAVPVPFPNDPTINPIDDPEVMKERERLQKMFQSLYGSRYPYHSVLGGNEITVGRYDHWEEINPEYPSRQYS